MTAMQKRHTSFSLIAIIIILVTSFMATAYAETEAQTKIMAKVATDWINVGLEQYKRNLYQEAEQSFLQAKNYKQFLPKQQTDKIDELLNMASSAIQARKEALEHLQKGSELSQAGQLAQAKKYWELAAKNEFLTVQERKKLLNDLNEIAKGINSQKDTMTAVYNKSVTLFRTDELAEARLGFVQVAQSGVLDLPEGKTAQDYINSIDTILARRSQYTAKTETPDQNTVVDSLEFNLLGPNDLTANLPENPELQPKEEDSSAKFLVSRNYVKVLFDDFLIKTKGALSERQFDLADKLITDIDLKIEENRPNLGEGLYQEYKQKISKVVTLIEDEKGRWQEEKYSKKLEEVRLEAEKKIADLSEQAILLIKQNQYEQAIAQLKALLAMQQEDAAINSESK